MSDFLAWLDNATTEELENEYLYAPEGLRRDGIAIELERRKLREMAYPHKITAPLVNPGKTRKAT